MHASILAFFTVVLTKTRAADDFAAILQMLDDVENTYDHYTNRTYSLPDDVEIVSTTLEISSNKNDGEVYDFIVIGGGSAGSVVAARLAENYRWKVLLLEAGGLENTLSRIPLVGGLLTLTDYNWGYDMEYQPDFARGLKNKVLSWPSGKALGGGSTINFMLYSRGHPEDYDDWEKLGNPGWGYDDVLKYFIKSEKCSLHHADYDYHGTNGNLSVEDAYQPKFLKAFVKAGKELGYKGYVDYNTPHQLGFTSCQGTLKHGRRHTTARAYLFDKIHQQNLVVKLNAFVTKILIDPTTKVAYGVEYHKGNTLLKAFANKEIVVSAGALNTPKILMLSGIGPEEHLRELGIPVITDLPVGLSLHDQPIYLGLIFKSPKPVSFTKLDLINPLVVNDFLLLGKGPYTSLSGTDSMALIKTNATATSSRADAEILVQSSEAVGRIGKLVYRIDEHYYKKYWGKVSGNTIGMYPVLLRPKSCGSVRLRNADPFSEPLLYGNLFSDHNNEDMKTMIAAIKLTVSLSETETFKRYGISYANVRVPGCAQKLNSDEYWECAIRTFTITLYHYYGTCKMGARDDPNSVVDHDLKVYGIRGLRIVDNSVIPVAVGAHMNAPAIMIGEKAADMIKKAWKDIPDYQRNTF